MKFYLSFAVLLSLSQVPVRSQEVGPCGGFFQSVPCSLSTQGQSMQGTWVTQIADASGNITTVSQMGTFSADGSYSGTNVSPLQSSHRGLWLRTGDRTFVLTTLFFTHDDKEVFNGIVKARITLTLAEDLQSFDSVAERIIMDTTGKVLQTITGIKAHGVRMKVELPRNL